LGEGRGRKGDRKREGEGERREGTKGREKGGEKEGSFLLSPRSTDAAYGLDLVAIQPSRS